MSGLDDVFGVGLRPRTTRNKGWTKAESAEIERLTPLVKGRWWAEYYVDLCRHCRCDEKAEGPRCDRPCPLERAGVEVRIKYRPNAPSRRSNVRRPGVVFAKDERPG